MGVFDTVILRHDTPDGGWHYDWLMVRPDRPGGEDDRTLIAFRLTSRPDEAEAFEAVRMADHRRVYLTHEGPISGRRGEVRRVCTGTVQYQEFTGSGLRVTLRFGTEAVELVGVRTEREDDRWAFVRTG